MLGTFAGNTFDSERSREMRDINDLMSFRTTPEALLLPQEKWPWKALPNCCKHLKFNLLLGLPSPSKRL